MPDESKSNGSNSDELVGFKMGNQKKKKNRGQERQPLGTKPELFSDERLNEELMVMMQDEVEGSFVTGQDSFSRKSLGRSNCGSILYPPVEIEDMGGDNSTKAQHYKNELHLLEEKKQSHDAEMRQLLEREQMKGLKAQTRL